MKVAFIGAGGIGGPMAECLVKKGFDLTVCDMREAALVPLRNLGARITQRVADCAGADFVVVMVATDAQVRAVALGGEGLLAAIDAARPPRVIIMSSVLPATVREVAAALAVKKVHVLDAPVSGGRISAANSSLTIMVGGSEADFVAARPVLDALGSNIVHCGPLGAGESVKIVNNILGVANMFLMTEATRLALELGLDVDWLADIMEKSSGRNLATRDYAAHKALYRLNTQSPETLKALVDVCRKDLALAQSLAESSKLALPLLEAIKTTMDSTPNESIGDNWKRLS